MKAEEYTSIELDIEELVLHGFAPSERYHIADAVQRELTHLLAEQGLSSISHDIEIAHVNGGTFDLQPRASADSIGAHIAQSVYRGLYQ